MTTDDEVVIRPKTGNQPRAQSAYMTLLNSLATDLDLMLNDLRSTPPRFIQPRASFPIVSSTHFGSDASHFLRSHRMPLGSVDSEDGNALVDDDLHTLLPGTREISTDDLSQSRASLVSSSDGGILAEGETSSSEASGDSTSPPCDLSLFERLVLTHPVWFLPGIQRAGAVHLLQGKEEGNFVVRGSSQANTMAVSVRLPPDTGPYIEHYLILSENGVLSLESSRFEFSSIPALIDHYAKCCDELPVQLTLPRALREASNRQQLSSLALLGQEFWRYPMANPRPSANTSPVPASSASKTESSGLGTTIFSGHQHKIVTNSQHTVVSGNVFSPGTPSDTASSLSSFTSTGQQMLSPESIDSVVLTMSPVDSIQTGIIGKTSTFKTQNRKSLDLEKLTTFSSHSTTSNPGLDSNSNNNHINNNAFNENNNGNIRSVRPTPPSTLNVIPLRIPPAPPPRWTKPSSQSPSDSSTPTATEHISSTHFTVTSTSTYTMESTNNIQKQNSPFNEILSPNANTAFQTISKRLSPEGECKTSAETLSSQGSKRWQSQSSKDSSQNNFKVISPNSQASSNRTKRSRARKESKHYQESDILESPQVYCRSNLGDKISDYEDLWSQENGGTNSNYNQGPALSSFRSEHRPDLLPETPTVTSLSDNILSPVGSISSSASQKNAQKSLKTPSEHRASPEFDDENGVVLRQNAKNQMEPNNNDCQQLKELFSPSMEINRLQIAADFNQESMLQQPRNRLGLLLTPTVEIPSPINESTPAQTPQQTNCKRDSPFYAEPADALAGNVVRRSQRGNAPPKSQRHSEPPKGQSRNTQFCQVLSPIDSEKSHHISGSLDELKKKPRNKILRSGRLDPWPVDSSWEFMGNDDQNDYDTDANWKSHTSHAINGVYTETLRKSPTVQSISNQENRLTINQIIAKKLPDLKIPEILQKTTMPGGEAALSRSDATMTSFGKGSRLSAYDNVERGAHSGYATSMICNGSVHSDDGTVFSEPWDSSQWDSFLPHDDTMSESIHLSKCRPVICNSEDDTIMEEFSHQKENHAPKHHQPQKIATILRSRSCRDREVLSHPRNKTTVNGPGDSIAAYALTLAQDTTSTFSRNIENFIACTKESRETSPQIIMRNMRQFMSGMKNYLVKHGEGDFQQEVLRARSMLKPDEFLNLDTILEGVMHQLVVLPLREHLYGLFVDYYTGTGDIQLLVENVKAAFGKSPADFGIRPCIQTPSPTAMQRISLLILRLQEAELPLAKLDILLSIVTSIIEATTNTQSHALGADDFLPLLVYIVAKCGFIGAEIEAEFMWCLLQPSLLNGEAGYYLTALCSAVHVLKSFITNEQDGTGSIDFRSSSLPACSSVLRVIIPDECNGSLQTRTLPIRPHTTTREVCRTIAHKARVTNPQDYALFKLVDGEETLLLDTDCPQEARLAARGKPCMLAYKRIDAKIAWPTTSQAFQ